MGALATAVVSMLSALLPILSGSAATEIDAIIGVLIQLIPEVVQEVEAVGPIISGIIAALKSSSGVTADQLTQLAALEVQYDTAFEAAATAAGAAPAQ